MNRRETRAMARNLKLKSDTVPPSAPAPAPGPPGPGSSVPARAPGLPPFSGSSALDPSAPWKLVEMDKSYYYERNPAHAGKPLICICSYSVWTNGLILCSKCDCLQHKCCEQYNPTSRGPSEEYVCRYCSANTGMLAFIKKKGLPLEEKPPVTMRPMDLERKLVLLLMLAIHDGVYKWSDKLAVYILGEMRKRLVVFGDRAHENLWRRFQLKRDQPLREIWVNCTPDDLYLLETMVVLFARKYWALHNVPESELYEM